MNALLTFVLTAVIFTSLVVFFSAWWILRQDPGSPRIQEIGRVIRQGAYTFLLREGKALGLFVLAATLLLGFLLDWPLALSFAFGAICSAFTGFLGMAAATQANHRSCQAATKSILGALKISFCSGSILGLSVASIGLLGILWLREIFPNPQDYLAYGLGASAIALFARVGGGIYTKAADVAADLVGKVEENIPEDDPRNPATIADNVGDNVGDVAGMGADLYESYVGSLIAALSLAYLIGNENVMDLPLILAAMGLLSSILGCALVHMSRCGNSSRTLNLSLLVSNLAFILSSFFFIQSSFSNLDYFWPVLSGVIGGLLIGFSTEYFTSEAFPPVKRLAKTAESGSAPTIIEGLSLGLISTFPIVLVITLASILAFESAGVYGVSLTAVGMLATIGISLAIDAYGPVADNAGGIANMAELDEKVRERTDALDSTGNTTAAIGKGFAIGSAAMTALAFFSTYITRAKLEGIDLAKPEVIVGLLLGAAMPALFSALTMRAVGRSAFDMIAEIRRQFRHDPKILLGESTPDYAKCIDISTRSALKEMLLPGFLALAAPLTMGAVLGIEALGGFLGGSLAAGVVLAVFMANAGGAWDNAKKLIEKGLHGGKGSLAHEASVTGDTVGDPLKDTAGPSLNILIKLMAMMSLLFAPYLA